MQCYCCRQEILSARQVKLRGFRRFFDACLGGPDSVEYLAYREEMTFRWAFICELCYQILDNFSGAAEIPGRGMFNLAGLSRYGKARIVDEEQYQRFQRRQAARMGLQL